MFTSAYFLYFSIDPALCQMLCTWDPKMCTQLPNREKPYPLIWDIKLCAVICLLICIRTLFGMHISPVFMQRFTRHLPYFFLGPWVQVPLMPGVIIAQKYEPFQLTSLHRLWTFFLKLQPAISSQYLTMWYKRSDRCPSGSDIYGMGLPGLARRFSVGERAAWHWWTLALQFLCSREA